MNLKKLKHIIQEEIQREKISNKYYYNIIHFNFNIFNVLYNI